MCEPANQLMRQESRDKHGLPMAIDARSSGDQINLLTQETAEEREKYAALPFLGKTSTLIFGALSHLGSKRREREWHGAR